jgi:hypothetical protein
VRRISGLLPPVGVTKRIEGERGCTYLFGVPFGRFTVSGNRFIYDRWPIVDELEPNDGTSLCEGSGMFFGRFRFCRFRLEPASLGDDVDRRDECSG